MSKSTKDKGWTPVQVAKSAWASTKLREPWAITLGSEHWGAREIKFHTLSQVLDMAVSADLGPEHVFTIPAQVNTWMGTLGLAPVSALKRATKHLSQEDNMDILGNWFNGGNGLPSPSDQPGSARDNARIRLYLGHPSLLNQFLRWLIRYLGAHETVDGRVDRDCERVINLCHELQDKPPVRRY